MKKQPFFLLVIACVLLPTLSLAAEMPSAEDTAMQELPPVNPEPFEPKTLPWLFNGMTGHLDKRAAQRGFQIYKQVCSNCHSMNLVSYRSLASLGFSEAEIKSLAGEKQVEDYDEKGQRILRPGKPFDHFVPPYANEDASRAANNGAYPPDLSLIVKAREGGADYVYSILTGFGPPAPGEKPIENKYYNPYFAGHWISMPPPLSDGVVTYQDGTTATIDQMARDVVTFLEWTAEPELEERHHLGFVALFFISIMTVFFYVAKRRVWKNVKH